MKRGGKKPVVKSNITETQATAIDNSGSSSLFSSKLPYWLIFAFGCLLYIQTIGYDFALDDAIVITSNKFTQKGFAGIPDLLNKDTFHGFFGESKNLVSGGRYRPLSLITFAIEHQFLGNNPGFNHFGNALLYGLIGVVMLSLLNKLFKPDSSRPFWLQTGFIATLIFIAHPIHTEAVANIKGRDELLCLLGGLAAMLWIWRYKETNKAKYLIGALLAFFGSLMSKENGITLIVIIPLTLWVFKRLNLKESIMASIPFVIVTAIYWAMRSAFTTASLGMEVTEVLNNPFAIMNTSQKFATIAYTFWKYLQILVIPHPLTHDYYYNVIPTQSWSNLFVILGVVIYTGAFIWSVFKLKDRNVYAYCILFYLITFSIVSNILFPIGVTMSERFVFWSSFGVCIAAAHFIVSLFKEKPQMIYIICIPILLAFSIKTVARNTVWEHNMKLFWGDIKASSESAKLNNSLGGQLTELADTIKDSTVRYAQIREGIKYLDKATSIYPGYGIAWMLKGNAYFKDHGQFKKAVECYDKSLEANGFNRDVNLNRAMALQNLGDYKHAIQAYYRTMQVSKADAGIMFSIAGLYKLLGNADSCIFYLEQTSYLNATHPGLNREFGSVYGQMKGDINKAIEYLNKAAIDDPKDAMALENLGVAYAISHKYTEAIPYFERALAINPGNPNVITNLTTCYAQVGRIPEAQRMASMLKR